MKTKSVPAIVMLSAGFVACVAGICAHMEVADFMKMLLIVLIVFYLLGGVVKIVLDRNFAGMNDEETTDGTLSQEEEDEVKEVVTLGTNEIDKVSGDMKNAKVSFIDGIGKNGDELISLLDIHSIIEEKENA